VKSLLESERVGEWREQNPRLWWGFETLQDSDPLSERVLVAIMDQHDDDESIDELGRFCDALEAARRAEKSGTFQSPPERGEKRSFEIKGNHMARMRREGRLFFRVEFESQHGWSGFFDTTNPAVVERVTKHRDRNKPILVVGEVVRRVYDFLVELDGSARFV
jgi:hypothetical protein